MPEPYQPPIQYFDTYEAREEAFRTRAFAMIPRKYLGPGPFWKDFRGISLDTFAKISQTPIAFVTSNPRDGIAFGTPNQVLAAACLRSQTTDPGFNMTIREIAEMFGIGQTLEQPVRTLSGGETVKLALAKSYALAPCTTRLVIASPFSWLSSDNISRLWHLVGRYAELGLPVDILALTGEDSDRPIEGSDRAYIQWPEPVSFVLRLKDVRLRLGTSFNTLYSRHTQVDVDDFSATLSSPCLLVGENGQGKSLVAKILARAVAYGGCADIDAGAAGGRVRLLFQDVIAQTLLRSYSAISRSMGGDRQPDAVSLGKEILDAVDMFETRKHGRRSGAGRKQGGNPPSVSLTTIKAILVAVRLCAGPSALVLDEPDWGMARPDAIAFVAAVIRAAHARGVPVLIISHKPWWRSIAGDTIAVKRTETVRRGHGEGAFRIALCPTAPGAQ